MIAAAKTYPPVGRCIYCGSTRGQLSDEHIIPAALNGIEVLPSASCRSCADITKRFEQTVARAIYGPLRIKLGFKTRRKKERPARLPVRFVDTEGTPRDAALPIEDFPTTYLAVKFPPPGLLTGAPQSTLNPPLTIQLKGNDDQISHAARALQQGNIELSNSFSWGPFCRQIAKIAHAYLVATIGTEGYVPLLPDIILGNSDHLSHFVGGFDPEPPPSSSHLSLVLLTHDNKYYLVVYVQLFGAGRLPLYQAVAAEVTNLDAVMTNVARLNANG